MWICGSNQHGQLGCKYPDECASSFEKINAVPEDMRLLSFASNTKNNYFVFSSGYLWDAGSNENAELLREGKKSLLSRVDSLE